MEIIIKQFDQLSNLDLYNIIRLRTNVFIYEQQILSVSELDNDDLSSLHYYIKINDLVISYARLIKYNDYVKIGRICTDREYRGQGYSSKIIRSIMREYNKVVISSQYQVVSFYEKLSFKKVGEEYLDAGIIHQDLIYEK